MGVSVHVLLVPQLFEALNALHEGGTILALYCRCNYFFLQRYTVMPTLSISRVESWFSRLDILIQVINDVNGKKGRLVTYPLTCLFPLFIACAISALGILYNRGGPHFSILFLVN